jgi:hypothetical protein
MLYQASSGWLSPLLHMCTFPFTGQCTSLKYSGFRY